MDLRYTESEQAFRDALREWLAAVLPDVPPEPARDDWDGRRVWDTGWQKQLHAAGYAGDMQKVLPRLSEVYGVELGDERVIWSNPDDESAEMKPLTPHQQQNG